MATTFAAPAPPTARQLGVALGALALALGAGVLLPLWGPLAIGLPILAVGFGALALRWPLSALLGLIALTSTVFAYAELPRVGTRGASLYLPELALGFLLVWALLARSGGVQRVSLMTWIFGGLLVAAALSVVISSVFGGQPLQQNLIAARYMVFYALYFVVRRYLSDVASLRRLVSPLMILGLATALFYDAAVLTELRGMLARFPILGVSIEDLYLGQTTASVAGGRVYMPGRALVQLLFFPALLAMLLVADAARTRRYGLISLAFGATIVLIMTRAVWVTTIVVLGATMLLVDRQRRLRLMQLCMGIVALALVVVMSLRLFSVSTLNLSPGVFGERFMTVLTDNFDDPTLQYRVSEASAVLQRSAQNWLTGVGFWAPIGSQLAYDQNADSIVARDVFAWHNGYLSLLLATGLVGLSFFVLLWLAVVRHCYVCIQLSKARLVDPFVGAITLGFGLSLVRILLNGFTESVFTDSFTVPLIAMGAAVLERGVEFQRSAPLRGD